MAILNPPQALPGVAFALLRFLHREGGAAPRDRTLAALHPGGDGAEQGNLRDTISALRALKLVEDGEGTLRITERLAGRLDDPFTRAGFDAALRREVHAVDRDGDPWNDASAGGGRDAGRALSWFLAQPALAPPLTFDGPPDRSADLRQRADLGAGPDAVLAFENDVRFGAFRRWAVGLGLATPVRVRTQAGQVATHLEPVPTAALAAELARRGPGQVPVGRLLNDLRRDMPYLPGGATTDGLEARVGAPLDPAAQRGRLHTSLGEALLTLEASGEIELSGLDDADGVVLEDGIDGRRVTHVTITTAVSR